MEMFFLKKSEMMNWRDDWLGAAALILIGGLTLGLAQPVRAGVNDFYFDSMEVDYYLSKNAKGQSQLKVKEMLYPVFPEHNQNRGIIRSIPLTYQKRPLDLKMGEILRDDQPAPVYKNETKSGFRELMIRDKHSDSYLHGKHKFEFNYTMTNVTLTPTDSPKQEFYWDTNGTGWRQRFNQVVARVHLDETVRADFNPRQLACYTGGLNSTERNCRSEVSSDRSVVTFTTTQSLGVGGNMTIALQFGEATFAEYKPSASLILVAWLTSLTGLLAIVLLIVNWFKYLSLRRVNKMLTITTEYLPPASLDVFQAVALDGGLSPYGGKMMSTGLVALAVARKLQIIEQAKKHVFDSQNYNLKVAGDNWNEMEQMFFRTIFNTLPAPDMEKQIDRKDYGLPERIKLFTDRVILSMKGQHYDLDATKRATKPLLIWTGAALVLAIISMTLSLFNLEVASTVGMSEPLKSLFTVFSVPVAQGITMGLAITALILVFSFKQLTSTGLQAKAQLEGLKRYIKMAETERLAFNQSVEGAARDAQERVVLYERLLPYAILFGLEKSWGKVLNAVYQETNTVPAWYLGTRPFSANSFAGAISSFSSVASSASASSSSGSGGGGFSGGGGGGGGGGGC